MSKFETARSKSTGQSQEVSAEEGLELRLGLLQQQETQKLQSNAALLKALQTLHTLIKEASQNVSRAALEVKAYPVEVVAQATTRVEHSVARCSQAADKARETYEAAKTLCLKAERQLIWWVLLPSLLSPMLMCIILLWALRR